MKVILPASTYFGENIACHRSSDVFKLIDASAIHAIYYQHSLTYIDIS